jgi:hypothetical protein
MSLHRTHWICLLILLAFARPCFAQKVEDLPGSKKSNADRVDPEARDLVRDILSQTPEKPVRLEGVLKIREPSGKRSEVPLQYSIVPEAEGWRGIYETRSTPWRGAERLIILHRSDQPNQYIYSPSGKPGEAPKPAVPLQGGGAALPFAGSDYWLIDLGLEFLHWPEQRLVRDATIKMRMGRPCKVLESTHPNPSAGGYSRVLSWLDAENGAPIYAEGFNAKGDRIKTFSLHGLTKVNGQWQPKDLEMVTEATDSKTQIEFSIRND